jgi:hypothetical protein
LDRELPSAEMEQVTAHLSECAACHSLCTELEGRAAHIGALMAALDAPSVAGSAPRITGPRPSHRWVPVAVALAAGLALAYYVLPKPQPRIAVSAPLAVASPVRAASAPVDSPTLKAAAPHRARRAAPKSEAFIALDDEPFESGVILRVDVPDTNVQADIVFSPDGRARAYRLVQASSPRKNKERSNE